MLQELSNNEIIYYKRQLKLDKFGIHSQEKLKNISILLIGVGGVGSPVSTYLTGLGVGTLMIVDDDTVDISNLHRQVLFSVDDIGKSKVKVAKQRLEGINPFVKINIFSKRLTLENYNQLNIREYDFIIDTSDNFNTKILSNKLSVEHNIPLLSGGVSKFNFQAGVFNLTPSCACLGCLYPQLSTVEHKPELGVIGLIAAQAGLALVNIFLNLLLNNLVNKSSILYVYDLTNMRFDKYKLPKKIDCEIC